MLDLPPKDDLNRDLGLGGRVGDQTEGRLLRRDGSFNVNRVGATRFGAAHAYHVMITTSWPRFLAMVLGAYFGVNALFATAYTLCGPGAIEGAEATTLGERWANSYFFSVQTLATIGYGKMTPHGVAANLLVSVEALSGLLGFALATGLLFARFSRPTADIAYSGRAVMGPYRGGRALMFRLTNRRENVLNHVHAMVTGAFLDDAHGKRTRRFASLQLERDEVTFLTLQWVVVHPVDEASPLWGMSEDDLRRLDFEMVVLLSATDETFSQTVHSRFSYKHHEIVWGARFRDIYTHDEGGGLSLDIDRLDEVDPAPLGS